MVMANMPDECTRCRRRCEHTGIGALKSCTSADRQNKGKGDCCCFEEKREENQRKTVFQNSWRCERTRCIAKLPPRHFASPPDEPGLDSRCNWSFQLHTQDFCKRQEGHRN